VNGTSGGLDGLFAKFSKPPATGALSASAGSAVSPSKNMSDMMPAGMMDQVKSMMAQFGTKGRTDVHSSTDDETKRETAAKTTNSSDAKNTEKKEKKAKKVAVASIA